MSVTAAQGFRAAGIAAGIKKSGKADLALVVNDGPRAEAAGVFTRNKVKAAPVLWSQQVLTTGSLRAVVLNSGGANACTGAEGFQVAHATAEQVAEVVGCGAIDVAVCSTGLIGEQLPRETVLAGVRSAAAELASGPEAGSAVAAAIMTTDTVPKESAVTDPAGWTVGGTTKGAGMIAPSMATMLSVVTTDAVLDRATLDAALREAVRYSFDRLDVDGSMSTNDTVLVLASGASGVEADPAVFTAALTRVCRDLAEQMQADAEIDPERLDVTINGVLLCKGAVVAGDRADCDLSGKDVLIEVELGLSGGADGHTAEIRTTDLSHAYVEENSAYSS